MLFLFITWWTFRLLLVSDFMHNAVRDAHAQVFVNVCFHLRLTDSSRIARLYDSLMFSFL